MGERSRMAQVVSPFCCCASGLYFSSATSVITVIRILVCFLFTCAALVVISLHVRHVYGIFLNIFFYLFLLTVRESVGHGE